MAQDPRMTLHGTYCGLPVIVAEVLDDDYVIASPKTGHTLTVPKESVLIGHLSTFYGSGN